MAWLLPGNLQSRVPLWNVPADPKDVDPTKEEVESFRTVNFTCIKGLLPSLNVKRKTYVAPKNYKMIEHLLLDLSEKRISCLIDCCIILGLFKVLSAARLFMSIINYTTPVNMSTVHLDKTCPPNSRLSFLHDLSMAFGFQHAQDPQKDPFSNPYI